MRWSEPSQINVLFEETLELSNFWFDDGSTISLPSVLVIVILMVPLSYVKLLNFLDLSHYLIRISWVFSFCCNLTQNLLDFFQLLLIALFIHND